VFSHDDIMPNTEPETVDPADLMINNQPDDELIFEMDDVNPAGFISNNQSEAEKLSQDLWASIMSNDQQRLANLINNNGAGPSTRTLSGETAMEMANRMNRVEIMRILFQRLNLAKNGLGTLLDAVTKGRGVVVRALMDLGMRERLLVDEKMKLIVFGVACKRGNPAMLETLSNHGPWFSWKAYKLWCVRLAGEGGKEENGLKVDALARGYMIVCHPLAFPLLFALSLSHTYNRF
jgi:hypothetical protein